MRKTGVVVVAILVLSVASIAYAGLDDFIRRVNEQALSDINRVNAKISAQFGIPLPKVQDVVKRMPSPGDAFMVFQLGVMTGRPPEVVIDTFHRHKGQGWGAIAKELGIKPGSAEFHRLKSGDFQLSGTRGGGDEHERGSGRDRERGHGKGKKHKKD